MTTYTLAISAGMLLATVADGGDINAAVNAECVKSLSEAPEFEAISGCTLTDDEPCDRDAIVWDSGWHGWIFDEDGGGWRFAVRAT
jgi:hypothetical protein